MEIKSKGTSAFRVVFYLFRHPIPDSLCLPLPAKFKEKSRLLGGCVECWGREGWEEEEGESWAEAAERRGVGEKAEREERGR